VIAAIAAFLLLYVVAFALDLRAFGIIVERMELGEYLRWRGSRDYYIAILPLGSLYLLVRRK
jgi:hypothetical protein